MGRIGNFGNLITFEVTSNKVLTPSEMKRTVSGRYKVHNIPNKKPKREFAGPDLDETSFTCVLSAERGVRPRRMLDNIEAAVSQGRAEYLVIGGKIVGKNKMCIESVSETWDEIWNKGELVSATISLTFGEYT